MNGKNRSTIKKGSSVSIVQKQDQRSGKLTRGIVKDILTNSMTHPHGIKVRLESGEVGRVKAVHKSPARHVVPIPPPTIINKRFNGIFFKIAYN
jgi:uncharacterized repeat protein (TIGR03833 family)